MRPNAKEGRVLVVDDEPMLRATLGQVLSDEGYAVDLAVDGESALEQVAAARPDVILLDLMMPGMNGRQFLEALREQPAWASIPVLIMTAVHGLNMKNQLLGAESEVVEKPFNVDELLGKVALAVYRSRDADRATSQPIAVLPPPPAAPAEPERGVVLVVEQDRARLQQLDVLLSARGFTVVSMSRSLVQIARLARALRPGAILIDHGTPGVAELVRDLREAKELADLPVLVYARGPGNEVAGADALAEAEDEDLVNYVERRRAAP